MSIIRWLFGLCKHEWVVIRHNKLMEGRTGKYSADEFVLQCKHCGNLKRKVFD